MIDYSEMTYEMAQYLPPDLFEEWLNYEPEVPPPSYYHLGTNEGRCAFLDAYIWRGEEVLFESVNHAWNSLSEPRAIKCIYIGMFAGTGGSGKWAIAKMLRRALREALDYDGPPLWGQSFSSVDEVHEAAMDFFAAQRVYYERTIQKYADILNGEPGRHSPTEAKVLLGPCPQLGENCHGTTSVATSQRPTTCRRQERPDPPGAL